MEHWLERRARTLRHIESGRRVIDRQRAIVAHKKALGLNSDVFENLLGAFERTQAIFEQDLADLNRRKPLE